MMSTSEGNSMEEKLTTADSPAIISFLKPAENVETAKNLNACLETSYERRMRKRSHYVAYASTFIGAIGFSIVLTGMWPYLKMLDPLASKELLGWVVAANPLGQMIFSPIMGLYANKCGSNRSGFVITLVVSIIGNLVYALLPLIQDYTRYAIMASRLAVGIGAANVALARSYIVQATTLKERTAALSGVAASQAIGFILGPSIQTGLVFLMNPPTGNGTSVPNTPSDSVELFNVYSMVGYAVVLLNLINIVLFLPCIFQDFNLAEKEVRLTSQSQSDLTFNQKVDYFAIIILLCQAFISVLISVLIETLIVPMCMDIYAWSSTFAVKVVGIGLTIAGVFAAVTFAFAGFLSKKFDERKVYLFLGLIPLAFSMLLFFPIGNTYPTIKYCNSSIIDGSRHKRAILYDDCDELGCPVSQEWCTYTPILVIPQLIVAAILTIIGYAASFVLVNGIYSKMLGFRPQGFWMGLFTSVVGFSRVVGPVFVMNVYTNYGMRWTFGSLFVVMVLSVFTCICFYKRFKPLQILTRDKEEAVSLTKVKDNDT